MARTQGLFSDRQRALVQPLRLAALTLCPIHEAQFVERTSVVCIIGSEACLCQPLKLLCIDLGGGVISARVMVLKGLVDRDDIGRLSQCGRERSERRECKNREKSDRLAARSHLMTLPRDVVMATVTVIASSSLE